jgi:hypothetical protein
MNKILFRLAGTAHGWLAEEVAEPLVGAMIRISGVDGVFAECQCDESGAFALEFRSPSPPINVELNALLQRVHDDAEPVLVPLGQPAADWRRGPEGFSAHVAILVAEDVWGAARKALDRWTVLGHVVDDVTGEPITGALVSAVDRDVVRDDPLGTAVTDASGAFRIDFSSAQFRTQVPLLGLLEGAGPDLGFHVETLDGRMELGEVEIRRQRSARQDVGRFAHAELRVKAAPAT